jgi:hypothetical protein
LRMDKVRCKNVAEMQASHQKKEKTEIKLKMMVNIMWWVMINPADGTIPIYQTKIRSTQFCEYRTAHWTDESQCNQPLVPSSPKISVAGTTPSKKWIKHLKKNWLVLIYLFML